VSLPDRTHRGSTRDAGAHVRLCQGGLQRCHPMPGRGVAGWGEFGPAGVARRVITEATTTEARAWLSGVASVALVGVGSGCPSGVFQLRRLGQGPTRGTQGRGCEVRVWQGQPAILPVVPQRIQHPSGGGLCLAESGMCGSGGRGSCAASPARSRSPASRWGTGTRASSSTWRHHCRRRGGKPGSIPVSRGGRGAAGSEHRRGGHREPEAPAPQAAEACAPGAGQGPSSQGWEEPGQGWEEPSQGWEEPGQDVPQGRCRARQGRPSAAGLSPQAGTGLVRENHAVHVEDLPHREHGHTPPVGAGGPRRRMGRVRSAAARERRTVRPDRAQGVPMAPLVEDCSTCVVMRLKDPRMGVPSVRHQSRSGPQRSTKHPRRRACGEAKRLWNQVSVLPSGRRSVTKQEAPQTRRSREGIPGLHFRPGSTSTSEWHLRVMVSRRRPRRRPWRLPRRRCLRVAPVSSRGRSVPRGRRAPTRSPRGGAGPGPRRR
jgi:hypothetical protein